MAVFPRRSSISTPWSRRRFSIVFNPEDTAENLRKYGGFIPGIRPGKRTAEYINYILTRLTTIGAFVSLTSMASALARSVLPW